MTNDDTNSLLPSLDGWALILGASSGFGEAAAIAFAKAGMNVVGVHLDRRATQENADRIVRQIESMGREAWFFNVNAADPERRRDVLKEVTQRFDQRAKQERFRVLMHSLAFGTLRPLVTDDPEEQLSQKQLEMTIDVMANSLVYWTQDAYSAGLLGKDSRIFAMTSAGGSASWKGYGAVSAAKCALESHIRQLACELGPVGITANSICAGVTDTPALRKIPQAVRMMETAIKKNPMGRLTTPVDVAHSLVALAHPATHWMTGNTIYIDGGEGHSG
jgi:NAD(P)-dependent dehydrogenase (short-subunit alcohol dehydrogenase family)